MPRLPHLLRVLLPFAAAVALASCAGGAAGEPTNARRASGELAGAAARPGSAAVGVPKAASALPARASSPIAGAARNAWVLLSGGGTPLTNNYSQYVQAKAVAGFFERECPPGASWVFFGVGNRDGAAPVLADVLREEKRDGLVLQSWLPGALPNNRPATRESFLRALRDEILPTVRGGGTLYLFVGDHGELSGKGEKAESAITLWQLKRGRRRSRGWYSDDREILGVAELRRVLAEGLGDGRVVFCMTQCHSGGFHELGIAREPEAPRAWFVSPPVALAAPAPRLRVAGFTATDQQSPAAGCDADPDPERWAGYERFMPEALFGADLLSARALGRPAASFADAHEAATLVDATIDKPRATSEQYLHSWARFIEKHMLGGSLVAPETERGLEAFQRVLDTGRVAAADPALRERAAQFARFQRQLAADVPAAAELLATATQRELDAALRPRRERSGARNGNRRGAMAELRRAWTNILRPAWKEAVHAGTVRGVGPAALEFERHLLSLEDDGRDFLFPRGGDDTALLDELYWFSGYAEPAKLAPARAAEMARWAAERRTRIVAWAAAADRPELRAAAEKIGPAAPWVDEPPRAMSRRTAVERTLFYRRVLAAWEFLVAMRAESALAELHALIELERTPLRPDAGIAR